MRPVKKSLLLVILLLNTQLVFASRRDLVFEKVYEAALDLPRIYFLIKRNADSQPLNQKEEFETHYAFLDTGASGILLSRETAESLGVKLAANAQYVDVGVGGAEYFKVSEPLHLCLASFASQNPENQNIYNCFGPWRVQIKSQSIGLLGEPLDVIGMPAMVGNIVVLNSAATNELGYFAANIKSKNSDGIPTVDFKIAIRLKKFTNPKDPRNTGPLPVSADNPVIDKIVVSLNGRRSESSWVLDTGAMMSLISTKQAKKLGLLDKNGRPLAKVAFSIPIGGVGDVTMVNGFEVDKLTIPTMNGFNLIFKNARLGVQDIKYFDVEKKTEVVIDGVLGSNFLCASAKMESMLPSETGETPFENIVIDLWENTLGFDLREDTNLTR